MPGPSNSKKQKLKKKTVLQQPPIFDPGSGPRVRDTRAFLATSFAQSPAWDIPLCAEFAQDEIRQMLCTILPEETALILWYNKSRGTSRICPACERLYHLGDVLPDLLPDDDEFTRVEKHIPPQLGREQELSGLCSPVCFILAAINFPGAIKSAWGRTEDELSDEVWEMLNVNTHEQADQAAASLGLLVRMTRLHDLGLAQLCFP
ncbi:hypothetical protein CPB85DRAFT_81455 [Mucidula mucida]|nr:hypothetical protein CPB85DRAFT_81455 [Mucidula mucida]